MSIRKIGHFENTKNGTTAKIYRDAEWNEYRVKFFKDGEYQPNSDYHSDTKTDAYETAILFTQEPTNYIKADELLFRPKEPGTTF